MERPHFNAQIGRLRTQWPNSYGAERTISLFEAFKDVSNTTFAEAISDCIANSRNAPLLTELTKAVEIAKVRENSYRGGNFTFQSTLTKAATNNRVADPDFVKACVKLNNDFQAKKITREQFLQGCDWLDQTWKEMGSR